MKPNYFRYSASLFIAQTLINLYFSFSNLSETTNFFLYWFLVSAAVLFTIAGIALFIAGWVTERKR